MLSNYFGLLKTQKNLSDNTIESYRTTFKYLLKFLIEKEKIPPQRVDINVLTDDVIIKFLEWFEKERNNSLSTRNQRLAAIHAFSDIFKSEKLDKLWLVQKGLNIPYKKSEPKLVEYLDKAVLAKLFQKPDQTTKAGCRDLTLLCLLYDSGARVSELCQIKVRDIRLNAPVILTLHGKGKKIRTVPLMPNTVELLKKYLKENALNQRETPEHPLFFNQRNSPLSRSGVRYVMNKYFCLLQEEFPELSCTVSPHVFRHTKAMHLYQAGIDLIYIRNFLGHTDIKTTEIYAKVDIERKREALEKAYPEIIPSEFPDWNDDPDLISRLLNL
ncbi:site-specific integrase [Enterococcus faecium]